MRWRPAGSRRSPRRRTATGPSTAQPGSAGRGRERRPDRRDARDRSGSGSGRTTSPPSSTASAEKLTASSPARAVNRRTQPRAVVYGTPAAAAAGRTPHPPARDLPDHRAGRLGRVQPPGQHERRQQRMSHPAAAAPDPRDEDLPLPPLPADMPPVTRPEHHRPRARRALRPRHPHRPSHRRVRIDRQRARPYHGHGESPPQIPSRDRRQTGRGGISTLSDRSTTILNRAGHPRSPHHQRTQPEPRRRCSANQAVNTGRPRAQGVLRGRIRVDRVWPAGSPSRHARRQYAAGAEGDAVLQPPLRNLNRSR